MVPTSFLTVLGLGDPDDPLRSQFHQEQQQSIMQLFAGNVHPCVWLGTRGGRGRRKGGGDCMEQQLGPNAMSHALLWKRFSTLQSTAVAHGRLQGLSSKAAVTGTSEENWERGHGWKIK